MVVKGAKVTCSLRGGRVCLEAPPAPPQPRCLRWGGEAGEGAPEIDTMTGTE